MAKGRTIAVLGQSEACLTKRGKTPPGRPLNEDDQALWDGYTRAVKRLHGRAQSRGGEHAANSAPLAPVKPAGKAALKRSTAVPTPLAPTSAMQAPPAPAIEQRLVKRVQRGRSDIDATIDLHGLTQGQAQPRLIAFLRQAQARDLRMVLVITGKGRRIRDAQNPYVSQPESGVLQRAVRLWLEQGECRDLVVGYADAHQRHGGSGAIYVQIRRARRHP